MLPHLANFRNSCKFEGLFATQKRSFATGEFLAHFKYKIVFIANSLKQSKWVKKGRNFFDMGNSLCIKDFFVDFATF